MPAAPLFRRAALSLLSIAVTAIAPAVEPVKPLPLIFDTDIGNDVDDVLAFGLLNALERRGECKLLAVTVTKDHALAAPLVDAINTFYGRGDVPIGVVRDGPTKDDGRFLKMVEERDGDTFRYPHDLLSGADAPDATTVLRRALASAEDGTVVIVQVGFSTNLARLLDSPADDLNKLTGLELIKQKVRLLSVMAGSFPPEGKKPIGEYNVTCDVAAARKLAAEWPTPIIYSGFEVGEAVTYPAASIEQDYNYALHHPLADAYRLYEPPPHNRPCWDLTSVLQAVRPDRGYFTLSPPGRVSIDDKGVTTFAPAAAGSHRYLKVSAEQAAGIRDLFAALCSEPPAASAGSPP